MSPLGLASLLFAFQIKHLAADFLLQTPAMLRNKGIYGHPVGASHSAVHAGLTWAVLVALSPLSFGVSALVAIVEFVVHYHTDWLKERMGQTSGYTVSDRGYWALFGLDQCMHQLTYVAIVTTVLVLA